MVRVGLDGLHFTGLPVKACAQRDTGLGDIRFVELKLVGGKLPAQTDVGLNPLTTSEEVVIGHLHKAHQAICGAVAHAKSGRTGLALLQVDGEYRFRLLLLGELPADLVEVAQHEQAAQALVNLDDIDRVPHLKGELALNHEVFGLLIAGDDDILKCGLGQFNVDLSSRIGTDRGNPDPIAVLVKHPFHQTAQVFPDIMGVEDIPGLGLHLFGVIAKGHARHAGKGDLPYNGIFPNVEHHFHSA